ncbi:MAG TPA: hypothetical protein DCM38_02220 [Gammaproteobacteria bacterium]|nr:hypothetical protein [Gammaproteobacteria bacterium]
MRIGFISFRTFAYYFKQLEREVENPWEERNLKVRLQNTISQKNELSDALLRNNIGLNQQTSITYDYLRHDTDELEDIEIEDGFTRTWKSQYFVDTVYGFWTSEDCFKAKEDNFQKSDVAKRKEEIDLISTADEEQRETWNRAFLKILASINNQIQNPSRYFYYNDGMLDIEKYKKQFEKQLKRDWKYANDSRFRRGYISGYDFIEVPPIRESSSWDELINSFLESLYFEINKSTKNNKLARIIKDCIDIDNLADSDSLSEELKINWNNYNKKIENFYVSNWEG